MKKDLISKEIIKELVVDIAKYLLNLDIENKKIEFLDKELKRIEKREADIIANVGDEFILHIEIQNQNDYLMPYRMMRYYNDILFTLLKLKKDLPIFQYLIYIGKEKAKFKTHLKRDLIDYKYHLIDMKKIDCNILLSQNKPEALILAILCDFKDKKPNEVIGFIIDRLKELENENEFRKYMLMLETLSSNRDLQKVVKEEEMLRTTTYKDLPSFQIGVEFGEERGIRIGEERGIKIGEKRGIKIGEERGIKKGILKGKILMLKELGFRDEEISKKLNISIKEVKEILK